MTREGDSGRALGRRRYQRRGIPRAVRTRRRRRWALGRHASSRERTQGGGHRDSLGSGGSNPRQALFASGVTRGAAREWPGECGATREARQRRKKVAISHATGDTVQRRGSQRRVCFRVCFPRRSRSAERKKPRLLRWQRESVVVSRTSAFRVRDSVRVTERACDRFRFRT